MPKMILIHGGNINHDRIEGVLGPKSSRYLRTVDQESHCQERSNLKRTQESVLGPLPANILQPKQMSQDTISGSPNRQVDCNFDEFTEMGSPDRKLPIQLNFEQTTNKVDHRKGIDCAVAPQEYNGAPAANHCNGYIAIDSRRNGGGNNTCPTQTNGDVSKVQREKDFAKHQSRFMKSLSPEGQSFLKMKMIIYLKLREAETTLTQGMFEMRFESFLQHFKTHGALPSALAQLASKLNDLDGLIQSCIEHFIGVEQARAARIIALQSSVSCQ